MIRIATLAAAALVLAPAAGFAAPCRDAKGAFIKCPPKAPVRCKANGKFAKCGTPGAKPV